MMRWGRVGAPFRHTPRPGEETVRHDDEYAVMRATIRERGTARMVLLPIVFIGWAGAAIATAAVITVALSTLVPLFVLVAGFEAIFALHVNVERVGRYLAVFHEPDGSGWEHVTMRFGQRFPGSGPDPLFTRTFILATSVNFLPAALGGEMVEIVVLAVIHLAFIYRVRMAQTFAGRQRAEDLARFTALRDDAPGGL
jgi:cell division protein FtsW (lipid II flippase)